MALRSSNKVVAPETVVNPENSAALPETEVSQEAAPEVVSETPEAAPVEAAPVQEPPVAAPEHKAEPKPEQRSVIIKPAVSALPAIQGEGCAPSLASLKAMAPAWLPMNPAEFEGVFPRLTGKGSGIMSDDLILGEFIDVQVMSHSERTFITPGNDESLSELNFLCRASYDHKTVIKDRESGEVVSIEDYMDWMMEEYSQKFPKLSPNRGLYHDIYCVIFNADKNVDKAIKLNMVQFSVSPSAVKFWKQFVAQAPIAVRRGQMLKSHQNCVRITGAAASNKDKKSYIAVRFEAVPFDILKDYEIILE